jgi:hypothetical protein
MVIIHRPLLGIRYACKNRRTVGNCVSYKISDGSVRIQTINCRTQLRWRIGLVVSKMSYSEGLNKEAAESKPSDS